MCLELCSRANWRQILMPCHRTLQLRNPSSWSWRVQHILQGQLPNSGAGGMARNPRKQARKQCCHLSQPPLTGQGRHQGQGPGDAAQEVAMSHCKAEPWSRGWLALRTGTWRVGDTKEGWWLMSKRGQHLFLQVTPQTKAFGCVQLGWRKSEMEIPQRLAWVFLKTGGTLRLHWNYLVPEQPKLNGNRHTCSWQTALSKDTTKISHRTLKTSVLMLST